jgi:hypothetical protein
MSGGVVARAWAEHSLVFDRSLGASQGGLRLRELQAAYVQDALPVQQQGRDAVSGRPSLVTRMQCTGMHIGSPSIHFDAFL